MAGGPLEGIRVIDQTSVVVGPICTRTLADQGADVIKVEAPGGDLLRTMARGARNPGMSGKFLHFNRNKRSIVLDLKHEAGLAAMKRLIGGADVFVSNVRPGALARAGLDAASLMITSPRLIHCSILAFGRGGRYFDKPAYDPIIQSLSGVAGTFEKAIGEPRFVPMVMTDHVTGLIAAQAIGFALFRRERTGLGEAIDVPMLENMASFVMSEHMAGMTFQPPAGPAGDNRLVSPDYRPLKTKDGFITAAPNTNAQAFAFFDVIGRPELKHDPRFATAALRSVNAEAYFKVRAEGLLQRTTEEWLAIFEGLQVPAARYNTVEEVMGDPHLGDVGFFQTEEHPSEGPIWRTRVANTFHGGARTDETAAPLLGQHTRDILGEIGYGADEVEAMVQSGAASALPAA